jgi:hypothetical protein
VVKARCIGLPAQVQGSLPAAALQWALRSGPVKGNVARIRATRERLVEGCRSLGLEPLPSAANFVFVRIGSSERAGAAYHHLRDAGILVRYFARRLLDDGLRITVGTDSTVSVIGSTGGERNHGGPDVAPMRAVEVEKEGRAERRGLRGLAFPHRRGCGPPRHGALLPRCGGCRLGEG